ncbi:MAG: hypothetical protein QOH65_571 [Methylobacteriaceae bacterium]|jgi:hypothetical protein|nr:hypothetical protein [Methylobacteriaceae bacterium]
MTLIAPSSLLRRALLLDAVASAGTGLLTAAGARILAGFCNVPESLLIYSGLSLLPFAAIVGLLARRDALPAAIVWAVIAYNALWSLDSIVLLISGWIAPNGFGLVFVIGQALVVAVLAECQYIGLRRSRSLASPVAA